MRGLSNYLLKYPELKSRFLTLANAAKHQPFLITFEIWESTLKKNNYCISHLREYV